MTYSSVSDLSSPDTGRESVSVSYLAGHGRPRWEMLDFADSASIARSKLLDDLEVLLLETQVELYSNLQLGFAAVFMLGSSGSPSKARWRVGAGGGRRFGCGGRERKTLDVLALHRARGKLGHGGQRRSDGGRGKGATIVGSRPSSFLLKGKKVKTKIKKKPGQDKIPFGCLLRLIRSSFCSLSEQRLCGLGAAPGRFNTTRRDAAPRWLESLGFR